MTSVLVLGASGYVGGAVVAALAASGAWRPIGADRMASPRLRQSGAEIRLCDATDAAALRKAADGVGAIVNAVLGDRETMLTVCRNVCDAAGGAGGARVVHFSTMSVYGHATGLVDEATALDPTESPYAEAKVACEHVMGAFTQAGGDVVMLRPGIVHGPGGQQWTGRLGRMLRQGRLGDLGELGDGRCNLTYIDDLGAAVVAALERKPARGEAFNVSDPDPPTWNQFLIALGVLIGATPVGRLGSRRMRLETKLLAPPLQVMKLLAARAKIRPGRLPEPIPPSLLRLFGHNVALDHRKADQGLGFARTAPDIAMAAAASWFVGAHGG